MRILLNDITNTNMHMILLNHTVSPLNSPTAMSKDIIGVLLQNTSNSSFLAKKYNLNGDDIRIYSALGHGLGAWKKLYNRSYL
ncbi:hypothetical protein COE51_03390 [Bacillus pseudomycoides]|nr:hypothetical protein COE51_03390 [Bacillus pseudomycoides]